MILIVTNQLTFNSIFYTIYLLKVCFSAKKGLVNLKKQLSKPKMRFESYVILYGTKTPNSFNICLRSFEGYVILSSTKTMLGYKWQMDVFESYVILCSTKTAIINPEAVIVFETYVILRGMGLKKLELIFKVHHPSIWSKTF